MSADDKRGAPRKNIRLQGLILDTDGAIVTRCLMVNVSASGAKIAVKKPSALPNTFNLLLSKKGGVRRQCEVVWRADKTIGVRFVLSPSFENEAISYMNEALARIGAMDETGTDFESTARIGEPPRFERTRISYYFCGRRSRLEPLRRPPRQTAISRPMRRPPGRPTGFHRGE